MRIAWMFNASGAPQAATVQATKQPASRCSGPAGHQRFLLISNLSATEG
jgi:hypothetical protein